MVEIPGSMAGWLWSRSLLLDSETRGFGVAVVVVVGVASSLRPNARPLPVGLVQTGHLGECRRGTGNVTRSP